MSTEKLHNQVDQSIISSDPIEAWFDDFIGTLRADQVAMSMKVVDPEKEQFYKKMMSGDHTILVDALQQMVSQYYIPQIIATFLTEVNRRNVKYKKIAFDLRNRTTILFWGEIEDEDYDSEKGFILSEAKVNFNFSSTGFYMSSTIVESSDNHKVPSHYKEVPKN
jgi:hypothetical protein